ncbi:MerR family transcriptional regulator [Streptomyces sp. UH6]|uniref:MerR family transcriptional regulator n=1 Tax=Streptomyces sp. UH6 TaxID=2748379 RepID=UPI0015D4B047|nr:MerR family transcriptional regulator [Streptomyces sp. UH6]NYV73196.1 MerR family transcriptional regulator [Streptomyces sp. UH6]
MPDFPNPELRALYQKDLGDIWEAARTAGVRPGTIRVWESRGKIERVRIGDGQPLYHLPTVKAAGDAGAKHRHADPAGNSRGRRARAA